MIKALINGIFKLVISLVSVLLAPIDALIEQFLPNISNALDTVSGFFSFIGDFIPFVISYTGLSPFTLTIIIEIFTFILTVPLMVQTVKLALAWYNKLKP